MERLRQSSSQSSTARRTSSPRSATTSSVAALARSSRSAASRSTPRPQASPQRRAYTYVDERGERTITVLGPTPPSLGGRRNAALGGALPLRGGVLRQRRRRSRSGRAPFPRPRRGGARSRDPSAGRGGGRRARGKCRGCGRALRAGRSRAGAAHRRHDLGSPRRLGPARRPVPGGAGSGAGRGCLRLWRLLRRGAHLCARPQAARWRRRSRRGLAAGRPF